MSLSKTIPESIWDENRQKCKGNSAIAISVNRFIESVYVDIYNIEQQLTMENKAINAEIIKARLKGEPDPGEVKMPTLIEYYDQHNERFFELIGTPNHRKSTYLRHVTSRNHTKTFIETVYGKSDIELKDVNIKFLNDYEYYFKTVRRCNNNSSMKYLKNLGKIMNLSHAEEYISSNPFNRYKITLQKEKKNHLQFVKLRRLNPLN